MNNEIMRTCVEALYNLESAYRELAGGIQRLMAYQQTEPHLEEVEEE